MTMPKKSLISLASDSAGNDDRTLVLQKSPEKINQNRRKLKTKPTIKKKKAKVDDKKPKKPPTAFFYFLEDFRKEFQEQNPDIKTMQDIGKAGGEKWKTMKYEDKVQYYDLATVKRAEFDKAIEKYNEWKFQEIRKHQVNEDSDYEEE
ncbi:high mobility group B protein 14 isoform X1 [Impatiens glandulifera]|uniref:high mobility group B protein 14 isoform X1 n=1 Tax=Impatiens glandulifera TaxID=253017 RepID=UPI001FB0CE92|nr:high mobility group B protein 14 isoform X1 [Impatiens glandulifera]